MNLGKFIFLIFMILPLILGLFQQVQVRAEDDVENEGGVEDDGEASAVSEGDEEDVDDEEDKPLQASPDADTQILFSKGQSSEFVAGQPASFLVGFTNKGNKDFVVETLDASFRYPMDFTYYIQNFTVNYYNRVVKPQQQITLDYGFIPAEALAHRPFGLTVNLFYKDIEGTPYFEAVFNETVNIIEIEEGLDGETFFLYVFLATLVVLLLVAGQQLLSSLGRKRPASKQKVELGTQNKVDVDYDWLPKETLNEMNRTPRTTPRQRRSKRSAGSGEE